MSRPQTAPAGRGRRAGLRFGTSQRGLAPSANAANNIIVGVRIRPPNSREESTGAASSQTKTVHRIVRPVDDRVLVFDPSELGRHRSSLPGKTGRRAKDISYSFDKVFGEDQDSVAVYVGTTKSLIPSTLAGINATVFAYGATGAGKTHTMIGDETQPGVMVLTMRDLFAAIDSASDESSVRVTMSYLEVYNEVIRDLLSEHPTTRPSGLPLREDPEKGIVIAGLTETHPSSAGEVFELLRQGNLRRTMAGTNANAVSSRSHAVLQIRVASRARLGNTTATVSVGKLSLIDLAGSERAAVTQNRGERLVEGANINRSLLALGNCINALCDSKRSSFVPYRDSKLTRLLKDSLGGNCKTVMIAAVSPSPMSYEDTHNTLKYANRAKNIKTKVSTNTLDVVTHISEYKTIIADLHAEVTALKDRLAASSPQEAPSPSLPDEMTEALISELAADWTAGLAERQSAAAAAADLERRLVNIRDRLVLTDGPESHLLRKEARLLEESRDRARADAEAGFSVATVAKNRLEALQATLKAAAGPVLARPEVTLFAALRVALATGGRSAGNKAETVTKSQPEIESLAAYKGSLARALRVIQGQSAALANTGAPVPAELRSESEALLTRLPPDFPTGGVVAPTDDLVLSPSASSTSSTRTNYGAPGSPLVVSPLATPSREPGASPGAARGAGSPDSFVTAREAISPPSIVREAWGDAETSFATTASRASSLAPSTVAAIRTRAAARRVSERRPGTPIALVDAENEAETPASDSPRGQRRQRRRRRRSGPSEAVRSQARPAGLSDRAKAKSPVKAKSLEKAKVKSPAAPNRRQQPPRKAKARMSMIPVPRTRTALSATNRDRGRGRGRGLGRGRGAGPTTRSKMLKPVLDKENEPENSPAPSRIRKRQAVPVRRVALARLRSSARVGRV